MTKKIYIKSFGCQMNVRDSEVVVGILKKEGFVFAAEPEGADIIIFNTCSVRQHAEDKVWSEIGTIVKRSAQKQRGKVTVTKSDSHLSLSKPIIGIIGCMAQNYREQIFERSPAVDFVVGPSDIHQIPEIINKLHAKRYSCLPAGKALNAKIPNLFNCKIWETDGQIRPEDIYHTGFYENKEHAYVVISEGCSNYCSYCVVPYVRGQLHNRAYQDILKEIEQAIAKGITKITLLGQNVNAYKGQERLFGEPNILLVDSRFRGNDKTIGHSLQAGRNTGAQVNFVDLLKMVEKIKGLNEFSFVTSHPRDTSVELFKAMAACGKLKKNLHLPVQSGSDKILESMNRGYTRKFYLDLVENYRKIVKGGGLTTDIIVGFCGESQGDFNNTYELVKTVEFDAAYIFKYSPRPNTAALKWPDDVPKSEKESRHSKILELQKEISRSKKAKGR